MTGNIESPIFMSRREPKRQFHPNRGEVLLWYRESSPESDSLPDLIWADAHFSKYIVRYPYRVIPGIVLGPSVFLGLGLTHSQANALGIGTVGM